jgi:Flp pilus assembly protein CpaB
VIPRRVALAAALVCAVTAGLAYYLDARRVSVVVAARSVQSHARLTSDDLRIMEVPLEIAPPDAIRSESDAVGQTIYAPVTPGQFVVAPLFDGPSEFRSGLRTPPGWRAVALPVTAPTALGGAVVPGLRVDIVAVPVAGRAPAGRVPERIATGLLVLDVRSDAGGPFEEPSPESVAAANSRLGSVIVAIPPSDEVRFADLIATSTLILFRSS